MRLEELPAKVLINDMKSIFLASLLINKDCINREKSFLNVVNFVFKAEEGMMVGKESETTVSFDETFPNILESLSLMYRLAQIVPRNCQNRLPGALEAQEAMGLFSLKRNWLLYRLLLQVV